MSLSYLDCVLVKSANDIEPACSHTGPAGERLYSQPQPQISESLDLKEVNYNVCITRQVWKSVKILWKLRNNVHNDSRTT